MKAYDHLRAKAVVLRRERGLALGEICARLGLAKTTVYHWIKDIPFTGERRASRQTAAQRIGTKTCSEKYRRLREQAYREAWDCAEATLRDLGLRDFVVLYMGEGYRRDRNCVSIANSNPSIVKLAHETIVRLATKKVDYQLQCHRDNDEQQLKAYWAALLGIGVERIKVIRKSNSGNMNRRQWRSVHGVLTVRVGDTYFRCRLQAWMDFLESQWMTG